MSGIVAFDVADDWKRYYFPFEKRVVLNAIDTAKPLGNVFSQLIDIYYHGITFRGIDIVWEFFEDAELAAKWNPREERHHMTVTELLTTVLPRTSVDGDISEMELDARRHVIITVIGSLGIKAVSDILISQYPSKKGNFSTEIWERIARGTHDTVVREHDPSGMGANASGEGGTLRQGTLGDD